MGKTVYQNNNVKEYILPDRVLAAHGASGLEDVTKLQTRQTYFGGEKGITLQPHGWLLLDFGQEYNGGVYLIGNECSGKKGARVRIRFGESAAEACSRLGEKGSCNDHAVRDEVLTVPWVGAVEYGNTGYRFLRIDNEEDYEISFRQILGVYLHSGEKIVGSFRCSDEQLNRLWAIGTRTIYLTMQDYVYDGIKRDRVVWIGDMHPEFSAISRLFENLERVRNSLDFVRDNTPVERWMNDIPTYTMWWVIIHRDLYFYSGDKEYLRAQLEYLKGVAKRLAETVLENGDNTIEFKFIDWPSSADPMAQNAGVTALLTLAMKALKETFALFGEVELQLLCQNTLIKLARFDCSHNGNKQAAALTVMAGINDAKQINEELLSLSPYEGISTFLGYYVLCARGRAGDVVGAIDLIKTYWGAMESLGATTFWEDFNLKWAEGAKPIDTLLGEGEYDVHGDNGAYCYQGFRHSLCHGWASGPVPFLSEYILGIKIAEAGCKTLEICPDLGELSFAEGAMPTPLGTVFVHHVKTAQGIKTEVRAPKAIKIIAKNCTVTYFEK